MARPRQVKFGVYERLPQLGRRKKLERVRVINREVWLRDRKGVTGGVLVTFRLLNETRAIEQAMPLQLFLNQYRYLGRLWTRVVCEESLDPVGK